jgi:hypothetical protein
VKKKAHPMSTRGVIGGGDELLDLAGLATAWRLPKDEVERLAALGLPRESDGRFRVSSIEAWMEKNARNPAARPRAIRLYGG